MQQRSELDKIVASLVGKTIVRADVGHGDLTLEIDDVEGARSAVKIILDDRDSIEVVSVPVKTDWQREIESMHSDQLQRFLTWLNDEGQLPTLKVLREWKTGRKS